MRSCKNRRKLNIKKIYLIRHGETDFNRKGIVQGSGVDASLNEKGREQALAFYEKYRHLSFDKIYSSTLKRSIETVEHFVNDGIALEQLNGLNEINWGNSEGKSFNIQRNRYYNQVLTKWKSGETSYKIDGGESPEDVFGRQTHAIERIVSKKDEELILICMHGRAMRVFLCQVLNYPLHMMDIFEHTNLSLYKLSYTGSMFVIDAYNDTSHLNGLR